MEDKSPLANHYDMPSGRFQATWWTIDDHTMQEVLVNTFAADALVSVGLLNDVGPMLSIPSLASPTP